jgi:hypothetical protein
VCLELLQLVQVIDDRQEARQQRAPMRPVLGQTVSRGVDKVPSMTALLPYAILRGPAD